MGNRAQGVIGGDADQFRMASLGPDPGSRDNEVFLTLGCVSSTPLLYVSPTTLTVPSWMNLVLIGIWDPGLGDWVADRAFFYDSPRITDDGASAFIHLRSQINQMSDALKFTYKNQSKGMYLAVVMADEGAAVSDGYVGRFDVDGLDDAFDYIGCFGSAE